MPLILGGAQALSDSIPFYPMKKTILGLSFLFLLTCIKAQTFEQKIEEMIELSGSKQNFDLIVGRMIEMQRGQYPDLSEEFWNRFEKALLDSAKTSMVKSIVPVYAKYLTEKDVEGVIEFYNSEAGQNLIESLPNIMSESMTIGQNLGIEIGQMIGEAMNQDRIEKFNLDYDVCELAKEGTFSTYFNGLDIKYIRTKNEQIEKYKNVESKYSIKWLSDSRYVLELISSNDPYQDINDSKPMTVNIISCGENRYSYLSKMEGSEFIMEGELTKDSE